VGAVFRVAGDRWPAAGKRKRIESGIRQDHAMGLDLGGAGTNGARSETRSDEATRRSRLVAAGLIAFPMISGLFFGLLSAGLVLPIGGLGCAIAVGALVGGALFAANAAALCIVQSSAWDEAARHPQPEVQPISEARAS
jgi:hypothetical protein